MSTASRKSQHFYKKAYYYLRLGRPLFLLGGFILHGLGVVMALYEGAKLDVAILLWTQVAITAAQIMTHYSNDYYDQAADAANKTPTRWSGGSRVLTGGHLPPRVAMITAVIMAAVSLFASLYLALALQTGPWTTLLLLGIALGWSYSSPPLQLNMHGLGEINGAILITGLTPLVGYVMQSGAVALLPCLAVFPLACFQLTMLLAINFPDAAGDIASGKHTLLYFLGPARTARLYVVVLLMAYLILPLLIWLGLPLLVAASLLLISPVAAWQGWRMWRGAWAVPDRWNSLGFWSVGLLIGSSAAELGAFLLLAWWQMGSAG